MGRKNKNTNDSPTPNTPFSACRSAEERKWLWRSVKIEQYQLPLPSTRLRKLNTKAATARPISTKRILHQFKLILAHKGMTAMGASAPLMQKGASLGLFRANEQQNRWNLDLPLAIGASKMSFLVSGIPVYWFPEE